MATVCPFCNSPAAHEPVLDDGAGLAACSACFNPYLVTLSGAGVTSSPLPGVQDVRTVSPAGSIGAELLAHLETTLESMPVLPEISRRVMSMVADPDVSMKELAVLIREDAVIASQVMRAANSAFYGGLHTINDLDAACTRLGMRTIANIVQTVANANLFVSGAPHVEGLMKQAWRHSVVSAACADELARLVAEPQPDMLYLSGLLHNIGRVALIEIVSNTYGGTLRQLRESPDLLSDVIGNFHPLVGLHALQRWHLPSAFSVAVFYHRSPHNTPHKAWLRFAHIIALAHVLASVTGYAINGEESDVSLTTHPSSQFLGLSDIKLASLRVDLEEKLEELISVFESSD